MQDAPGQIPLIRAIDPARQARQHGIDIVAAGQFDDFVVALPQFLAEREFDAAEVGQRLEIIALREAELATSPDGELRFHSGPPG